MKVVALIPLMPLAACGPSVPVAEDFIPDYRRIETTRLSAEIVQVEVEMTNALTAENVKDYGDCAAAGYALSIDGGYARHLRTKVDEDSGVWTADAVYTISRDRPSGLEVIDAAEQVENCATRGIPTV